jgi:ribonuclease HII
MIIGVDEVGRGPIAGDLVVCAAAFTDPGARRRLAAAGCELMDSKAFSSRARREKAFEIIEDEVGVVWSLVRKGPAEIDAEGIHLAVLNAMQQASLHVHSACGGCVDPQYRFDGRFVPEAMKGANAESVIKGDSLIAEISLASIVAKVIRDREMCELAKQFPQYGFEKNSGYGTAQHISAIKEHGLIAHHRSWARKFLQDV